MFEQILGNLVLEEKILQINKPYFISKTEAASLLMMLLNKKIFKINRAIYIALI